MLKKKFTLSSPTALIPPSCPHNSWPISSGPVQNWTCSLLFSQKTTSARDAGEEGWKRATVLSEFHPQVGQVEIHRIQMKRLVASQWCSLTKMGWREERPIWAFRRHLSGLCQPRETDTGRMRQPGRQSCGKFHSSPSSGGGESLEGTHGPTHFGRKTYASVGKSRKCHGHWERLRGWGAGGCTVSQSTVITDHSGGDHATDAETTRSKNGERGLSGGDSAPVTHTWPQVSHPGVCHRAADRAGGRGVTRKGLKNKQRGGNGSKPLQGSQESRAIPGAGWTDAQETAPKRFPVLQSAGEGERTRKAGAWSSDGPGHVSGGWVRRVHTAHQSWNTALDPQGQGVVRVVRGTASRWPSQGHREERGCQVRGSFQSGWGGQSHSGGPLTPGW